jgi:hypothetical protein
MRSTPGRVKVSSTACREDSGSGPTRPDPLDSPAATRAISKPPPKRVGILSKGPLAPDVPTLDPDATYSVLRGEALYNARVPPGMTIVVKKTSGVLGPGVTTVEEKVLREHLAVWDIQPMLIKRKNGNETFVPVVVTTNNTKDTMTAVSSEHLSSLSMTITGKEMTTFTCEEKEYDLLVASQEYVPKKKSPGKRKAREEGGSGLASGQATEPEPRAEAVEVPDSPEVFVERIRAFLKKASEDLEMLAKAGKK